MSETPLIRHNGSACPCHSEALVTVVYENGFCSGKPIRAGSLRWPTDPRQRPFNIVEYAVLEGPPEEFRR